MNIYADRGNIAVLRAPLRVAGLGFELGAAGSGERARPGMRTTSSTWAAARTATRRRSRATWPTRSARRCTRPPTAAPWCLAVCGGYQLLGHAYEMGGEELPGVGLVDLRTVRERRARA